MTQVWKFGDSTSASMYRHTKMECVLSAISVKGFPIAVGLSQENKAYTPTEALNTE